MIECYTNFLFSESGTNGGGPTVASVFVLVFVYVFVFALLFTILFNGRTIFRMASEINVPIRAVLSSIRTSSSSSTVTLSRRIS